MLLCILLFFSSSPFISSHVIQPNPQIGSSLPPGLSRRVTNTDFSHVGVTCSTLYGRPAYEDCRLVVIQIMTELGTHIRVMPSFIHDHYEFVAPGRQGPRPSRGAATYHTPLYWRA
ncbi:MAG: hypothetical protein Q9187_007438, partial [Circinaria calcarea]